MIQRNKLKPSEILAGKRIFLVLVMLGLSFFSASAFEIKLDPPGKRDFISDHTGMLDSEVQAAIKLICDRLLADKATLIMVVTIESMAKYGGEGLRIETFANLLFDQLIS